MFERMLLQPRRKFLWERRIRRADSWSSVVLGLRRSERRMDHRPQGRGRWLQLPRLALPGPTSVPQWWGASLTGPFPAITAWDPPPTAFVACPLVSPMALSCR